MACTEEKQNLRGIINHSGLSTVVLSRILPSSLLTSYTPSARNDRGARHAGVILYVLSRTDTTYFVYQRLSRAKSAAHAFCGVCRGFISRICVVFSLDEDLSRGARARVLQRHVSVIITSRCYVTCQILIRRNVISSFIFQSHGAAPRARLILQN